ncbi:MULTISPECIES: hypothetical protein [unclassified Rhizobium]|uniref:hypothetical protein n=1 Tax=unclassified Rhizobium TaxID=2613769 RepID=UPI001ADB95A7|nr:MULTISPECIES: hypothetical protein [unclassified Rhizobium]MBO9127956.1 hypothetical protein [Rhizobium sp. 16-488-2b]MBO9178533.1 hypothetical protein [Rhizobium sp. 16-488-2a]
MSRYTQRENKENYATGFPLLVIGSAMIAIVAYLAVGAAILAPAPISARVYVQAETPFYTDVNRQDVNAGQH